MGAGLPMPMPAALRRLMGAGIPMAIPAALRKPVPTDGRAIWRVSAGADNAGG
jgi:hypothetical protein